MTRPNAMASLIALALAGGLAACSSMSGDSTVAAAHAGQNASTVAQGATLRSAQNRVSNPTNGGSAFVGGFGP